MVGERDPRHAQFLRQLDASAAGVLQVAEALRRAGNPVQLTPTQRAPTRAQAHDFSDGGDLYVLHRVEVKHLRADFTSRADWPYPDFIVCSQSSFDRAFPAPLRYYLLNRAKTHVAIVRVSDAPFWTVAPRTDRTYTPPITQDFYFCPLDLVRFCSIHQLYAKETP